MQGPKTFTIQQANRILPKIIRIFNQIDDLKKKIFVMSAEAEWLKNFWGSELRDTDNPDSQKYDFLKTMVEEFRTDIVMNVEKIQELGCLVKDLDGGLIDFYSLKDDELVFLCWKYGEKEVKYWHPVEGGFRNRKPVEEAN